MTKVLFDIQQIVERMTNNMISQTMAKTTFINNKTFLRCLHSKDGVQYFHLDLPDNMRLFLPPK